MRSGKHYNELFLDLEQRFLAVQQGENRKPRRRDSRRFTRWAAAFDPTTRELLKLNRRAARSGNRQQKALPLMIDAACLVLHAARQGSLCGLGEIEDAEKLLPQSPGVEALLSLWRTTVVSLVCCEPDTGDRPALQRPLDPLMNSAAACRHLSVLVSSNALSSVPNDADFRPAAWFSANTHVPPARLRQAVLPSRRTKKVRCDRNGGIPRYSAADARMWWPQDMRP